MKATLVTVSILTASINHPIAVITSLVCLATAAGIKNGNTNETDIRQL